MQSMTPHSRLLDRQPIRSGHAGGGTVLGRDVAGRVEIGVEREAALATDERRLTAAVVAGSMPAGGAGLRGMGWIHEPHRYPNLLGLVPDEGLQLLERPSVQATGLPAVTDLDPSPDVLQVFEDDGAAGLHGDDDLLREDVVAVAPEAGLSAAHLLQVPFGGLGARGLERPAETEVAFFDPPPTALTEEAVVGYDGGAGKAKVNADHIGRRSDLRRGHIYRDVEPPTPLAFDQVGGKRLASRPLLGEGGDREGHGHPSFGRREAHRRGRPVQFESVPVETRRASQRPGAADLPALKTQRECRLQGLGRFDAGLNVQVGDKSWKSGLEVPVGRMVQADAIVLVVLPAPSTAGIEGLGELRRGVGQRGSLFGSRLEYHSHRSIHTVILPYTGA